MHDPETHEDPVVDLGQASLETKGQAIFDIDLTTGPSKYVMGLVSD